MLFTIKKILTCIAKVQIISLIDIITTFNLVRVKEGNKEKIAF